MRKSFAFLLTALATASVSLPGIGQDKEQKPAPWIGVWQLVSGERQGVKMADASTGGFFVITKDTITGMNAEGEVLSLLSYKLDGEQSPAAVTLTTEKPVPGETREAIIGVKDGKLYLVYNLDKKGRPKDFTTGKEGNNDRLMVFVPSNDPREVTKEIKALSEKKWLAFRDEDAEFFNGKLTSPRMTFTGRDGVIQDRYKLWLDLSFENGRGEPPPTGWVAKKKDPKAKIDSVKVSEQALKVFGDTVIETGRSVATRKDQREPVWDVRYTSVWVREKKQWLLAGEQHTAVR